MSEPPLAARFAAAGLDWIVPDWPAPPNVCAFSTTKNGEGGGTLDLSRRYSDFGSAQLLRWLPSQPLWLNQVHGSAILGADDVAKSGVSPPTADGAVARGTHVVCAVLSADCLPVLLTDRAGSVVAAVHAGWRGLAAGVLEAAVTATRVAPSSLLAWLGPAIGPNAFEVGNDVLDAHCHGDPGAEACFVAYRLGKWLADLYALARRRLARLGLVSVHGGGRCTFSEREVFYSYRRGGAEANGRVATLIWRAY